MEYITAKEIAEKWGVSVRWVQKCCKQGSVPLAQKRGGVWFLPADSSRPENVRFAEDIPSHPALYPGLFILGSMRFDGRSIEEIAAGLPDDEYRNMFYAELAYYSGDEKRANLYLDRVQEKGRFRLTKIYGRTVFYAQNGNYRMLKVCFNEFDEVAKEYYDDPVVCANIELAKAVFMTGIYSTEYRPQWLMEGDFSGFSDESLLFALYVYARFIHATGNADQLWGITKSALSLSRGKGFSVPELYLSMLLSIALLDLREVQQARAVLRKAYTQARNYHIYLLFYESMASLRGEFEIILREDFPGDMPIMTTGWELVFAGWTKLHNSILEDNVSDILTLREHQIGLYLLQDLSYSEIAERMGLSPSRVRNALQKMRNKLGVKTSAEIVQYVRWNK